MTSPLLIRLLIGIALLLFGHGLQGILLGVRASIEGFPQSVTGLIMAGFFAGFIAGSILGPHFVQRAGHIRAFAAFASLASIVTLAHALFVDPVVWVVLRALHGAAFGVLLIVAESWLNSHASPDRRGSVLAIYGTVFLGAWGLSQLLLVTADPSGFRLFAYVSILISASLIPLALGRADAEGSVTATRASLARLYAISPLGVVGAFLTGLALNAFWTMGPVYASGVGLANHWNALFMAASLLGGALLQWPIGRLSDRFDRRRAIVGTCGIATLLALLIAGMGTPVAWQLVAVAFGFGAIATPLYSLCIAHANDHVSREEHVGAASALLVVYGVGAMIGPFVGGFLMDALGPPALFLEIGAALALMGLFGLWRMGIRASVPLEAQDDFVAVPTTTHMESDLDPRGIERDQREQMERFRERAGQRSSQ